MQTTQEWHGTAGFNMTQAQQSHAGSLAQCDDSVRAHKETGNNKIDSYLKLHGSLDQKVNNSRALLDTLKKRSDSLMASIQHTRASLADVTTAYNAKNPPLQKCQWRMEQRGTRPHREKVRDVVELALESERDILNQTKVSLSDAAEKTKYMIDRLETKLAEVRQDIGHKAQALSVDELCLKTTKTSLQTAKMHHRPPWPGTSPMQTPTGAQDDLSETGTNELMRHTKVGDLDVGAVDLERAAKALREDNEGNIAQCKAMAEEAAAKTERATQERLEENRRMRWRLEDEIRETNNRINHTTQTIGETNYQIEAMEEPMAHNSTCTSWRTQRVNPEQIQDPVSASLGEHYNVTVAARSDLMRHNQAENFHLNELHTRRQQLIDDLNDKTSAHHIDTKCLNHGAQMETRKPVNYLREATVDLLLSPPQAGVQSMLGRGAGRAVMGMPMTTAMPSPITPRSGFGTYR